MPSRTSLIRLVRLVARTLPGSSRNRHARQKPSWRSVLASQRSPGPAHTNPSTPGRWPRMPRSVNAWPGKRPPGKRESLSEAGESRAPQDPSKPPIDKPERDLETTRNYWTEVPRFLRSGERIAEKWPWRNGAWIIRRYSLKDVVRCQPGESANAEGELNSQAEPSVSDNVRAVESATIVVGWLAGFDCRLKGRERLMEKVAEALEASSQMPPPEEIVSRSQMLFVILFV